MRNFGRSIGSYGTLEQRESDCLLKT